MTTRSIFALLLLFFVLTNGYAQHNSYIGVGAGMFTGKTNFRFGCTNCGTSPTQALLNTSNFGYVSPYISMDFERSNYYSFMPTLSYSRISNGTFNSIDSITTIYRASYLGLSLINKMTVFNKIKVFDKTVKVYALAGPQFRKSTRVSVQEINRKGLVLAAGYDISDRIKVNRNDVFLKGFDINLRTGIGLSAAIRRYKISLEWIRDFHFFDIDSRKLFQVTAGLNRGLRIGIALQINNRKEKE